ncbi:iron-binding protein IscA [Spirochaetota bacterium]|nr:iron-binding protein IscA [Spirochaetota bacterium]
MPTTQENSKNIPSSHQQSAHNDTDQEHPTQQIVTLTGNAISEIKRRLTAQPNSNDKANSLPTQNLKSGLRLGVKGGGCSGLSYIIDIDEPKEKDHIDLSYGFPVFIDPKSSLYLKGIVLDYEGGFMGSGFKFNNPNASNTCGCGESFSL